MVSGGYCVGVSIGTPGLACPDERRWHCRLAQCFAQFCDLAARGGVPRAGPQSAQRMI